MPKVKILQGIRMDLICPNLPIGSKINVNKKRWYTAQLKDNLILIIFCLKTWVVWTLFLQLCAVKGTDDVIAKNYIFPVKTIEIFAWIVPVKLNYESIVDRGGPRVFEVFKNLIFKLEKNFPESFKRCNWKNVMK